MTDIDPWAPPAPIGPHITAQDVTEWQQLAWTMLADDAGVDLTTVTEDVDWQDEAERKFGQVAAAQIRAYDALMTIRFGPETSQGPAVASAVLVDVPAAQVDTAEAFARTVQTSPPPPTTTGNCGTKQSWPWPWSTPGSSCPPAASWSRRSVSRTR